MAAEAESAPLPRQNAGLAGQGAAERVLLDAYRSGRLPHAWLLTGPRGIGKATLAYRFARFILNEGPASAGGLFGEPLPPESVAIAADTPAFRKVAAASHPDLFIAERRYNEKLNRLKTEIEVDDIRDLGNFLHLTPAEGGWRVAVIDSADDMNRYAANAVLKLLEEPPKRALLLLISHAPGGLLPTIRSRCRKLAMSALDEAGLGTLLARHLPDADAGERMALARLAEGSLGRALELAAAGGVELYGDLIALFGGLPRLDIPAAHALADRLTRKGQDGAFAVAIDLMLLWLSRIIRCGTGAGVPGDIVAGEGALVQRLAAAAAEGRGLDRWLDLWDKLARSVDRADGANLDRKQVFLNAVFGLEAVTRR